MTIAAALRTVESQLAYWQQEREAASRVNDAERIARCEKFVAQCELVLGALRDAQGRHCETGNQPFNDPREGRRASGS